jgi:hypothetical protein
MTNLEKTLDFDPNSYPEEDFNVYIDSDKLPDFVHYIIRDASIKDDSKISFVNKNLLTYLTNKDFQSKVNGWTFMFVKGEYIGVFKNEEIDMKHIENTIYHGQKPLFVSMYSPIYGIR